MYFDFYRYRWFFSGLATLALVGGTLWGLHILMKTTPVHAHGIPVFGAQGPVLPAAPAAAVTPSQRATASLVLEAMPIYTLSSPSNFTTILEHLAARTGQHVTVVSPPGAVAGYSNLVRLRVNASPTFCLQVPRVAPQFAEQPPEVVACPQ